MFELPEYITLARQMNEMLAGKTTQRGKHGNSSHIFVWYNRKREEFEELTRGKHVGVARVRGRWLTREVTERGGRNDEVNLFGKPGGYIHVMDSNAAGKPCPECGRMVEKMQYLGRACYFWPKCQV